MYQLITSPEEFDLNLVSLTGVIVVTDAGYPQPGYRVYLFPNSYSAEYFIVPEAIELTVSFPEDIQQDFHDKWNHKTVELYGEFYRKTYSFSPEPAGALSSVYALREIKPLKFSK
ncbi:hypothetical protein L2755_11860 [Shewanella abyssi]|uniref:hypothetical protein n=1 Tax=Shewanella abyssi TaxID=311789 RepID=UPI00200FC7F9|nr:hypothetical protein [Shewanella abyssi]MCL1050320.1 hypothetical protein [Shewanella abyssi]